MLALLLQLFLVMLHERDLGPHPLETTRRLMFGSGLGPDLEVLRFDCQLVRIVTLLIWFEETYAAKLVKLPIQGLLLFGAVTHLPVVTQLKVLPVEWGDGVCGLVELVIGIFVVFGDIFFFFGRLTSIDFFVASFAGDWFRCFLGRIFGRHGALAGIAGTFLCYCGYRFLTRVLGRVIGRLS